MTLAPAESPLPVARFERRAMGSPLRLTLVGIAEPRAALGWSAVSDEIEAIEQALSRFRPTSDLVALNARAGAADCLATHPRLVAALAAADRAHRVTGGAFDPRILRDLERLGYIGSDGPSTDEGRLEQPGGAQPRPTEAPSDRWLAIDPRRGRAAVAAPVDLGGIGKGLALRWAMRTLVATLPELAGGTAGLLLEAGGDLVAHGAAPQAGSWMVGIEDPRGGDEVAIIAIDDGAVCTSSIAVHSWTTADGRSVHHLLDPRTGEPGGAGLLAVTVAGPDPAWAEVWSKALFLEASSGIGRRARALGLAAWWVGDEGALEMTPAARVRTAWVAAEA